MRRAHKIFFVTLIVFLYSNNIILGEGKGGGKERVGPGLSLYEGTSIADVVLLASTSVDLETPAVLKVSEVLKGNISTKKINVVGVENTCKGKYPIKFRNKENYLLCLKYLNNGVFKIITYKPIVSSNQYTETKEAINKFIEWNKIPSVEERVKAISVFLPMKAYEYSNYTIAYGAVSALPSYSISPEPFHGYSKVLVDIIKKTDFGYLRLEISSKLIGTKDKTMISELFDLMNKNSSHIQQNIIRTVSNIGDRQALEKLKRLCRSDTIVAVQPFVELQPALDRLN